MHSISRRVQAIIMYRTLNPKSPRGRYAKAKFCSRVKGVYVLDVSFSGKASMISVSVMPSRRVSVPLKSMVSRCLYKLRIAFVSSSLSDTIPESGVQLTRRKLFEMAGSPAKTDLKSVRWIRSMRRRKRMRTGSMESMSFFSAAEKSDLWSQIRSRTMVV